MSLFVGDPAWAAPTRPEGHPHGGALQRDTAMGTGAVVSRLPGPDDRTDTIEWQ